VYEKAVFEYIEVQKKYYPKKKTPETINNVFAEVFIKCIN